MCVCVCARAHIDRHPTFVNRDDVGVFQGGHDLYLPADVNHVLLLLDLLLPDGLDSHLGNRGQTRVLVS